MHKGVQCTDMFLSAINNNLSPPPIYIYIYIAQALFSLPKYIYMYIDPHLHPISGIIYDGRTADRRFLLNLPFQVSYSLPSQLLSLVLRCVCTPNPFFFSHLLRISYIVCFTEIIWKKQGNFLIY